MCRFIRKRTGLFYYFSYPHFLVYGRCASYQPSHRRNQCWWWRGERAMHHQHKLGPTLRGMTSPSDRPNQPPSAAILVMDRRSPVSRPVLGREGRAWDVCFGLLLHVVGLFECTLSSRALCCGGCTQWSSLDVLLFTEPDWGYAAGHL